MQNLALTYDANGNQSGRGGDTASRSIGWSSYDLPLTIGTDDGASSQFAYTPDRRRWKQVAVYPGGGSETTLYLGGIMEKLSRGTVTEWKHYIPAGSGSMALQVRKSSGSPASATYYLTGDHLGSASTVMAADGTLLGQLSFAALGSRRGSGWQDQLLAGEWATITATTRRGFTGHEHLDNLSLVHMNGRVYDPKLGRFLSADPVYIGNLGSPQTLNPYSYVGNNPLSYVDPSGFSAQGGNGCGGHPNCWEFSPPWLNPPPTGGISGNRGVSEDAAQFVDSNIPGYENHWNSIARAWIAVGRSLIPSASTAKSVSPSPAAPPPPAAEPDPGSEADQMTVVEVEVTARLQPPPRVDEVCFYTRGCGVGAQIDALIDFLPLFFGPEEALFGPAVMGITRIGSAARGVKALPALDRTGKVHGALPKAQDLGRYSRDELRQLQGDLRQSVQERIRKTSELGPDWAHGQRQAAEQQLIIQIEKFLSGP